ncbi:hypothetical protein SYJ56_07950 [Algoriphagus sp. D3-2-R+10]|uniref:hypothetical protein n=1 Tax=Algoriphagus aurantiacus TaxID=3103948 RepID=UPI002B391AD9|nr:hypothetical protein [Algoriphagus sp. D3-2-R+10]MEB2775237.1 hypothetical protein [Algoriphagus sp. D3-2-R+10]
MAFEININKKYTYSTNKSKPIATGNSGGTDLDTIVSDLEFVGTQLTLKQNGQDDLVTNLVLVKEDIPNIDISQVNDLQNNLDDFVRHNTNSQGLDPTQKQNARTNIDVYSINEINTITGDLGNLNTIDKSNLVVGINQANSWKEISW